MPVRGTPAAAIVLTARHFDTLSACGLAQDENMTIAEMQELMRHASIASTTRYLRPSVGELVDNLDQWQNTSSCCLVRQAV